MLATGSDGSEYVVKLSGVPSNNNTLFNEAAGTELYRALGLPTPMWRPIYLSAEFLTSWDRSQSAFDGDSRRRQDIGFASRCVSSSDARTTDILSSSAFARIKQPELFWLAWLTDVCASHTDNRQAIFLEDSDRHLEPIFVDHGEMFGGRNGNAAPLPVASRYLDPRAYPAFTSQTYKFIERRISSLDCDVLVPRISRIPVDWRTDSAQRSLVAALERLTQRRVWENLLHGIALNAFTTQKRDDANYNSLFRASSARVLHARVQES